MQYDFNLVPNGAQRLEVAGRFFKYTGGTGKIRVTTSKGATIDLTPGQGVWGEEYLALSVKDLTGAANVGVILAGNYDFRDDTVAISGSINVGNDLAHRVPIQFDPTATILQGAPIMAYTDSAIIATSAAAPLVAVKIIDPVKNVNGIILCDYSFSVSTNTAQGGIVRMLAKATAPAGMYDGDPLGVLALNASGGSELGLTIPDISKKPFVRLPAGRGLWLIGDQGLKWSGNLQCLYQVL